MDIFDKRLQSVPIWSTLDNRNIPGEGGPLTCFNLVYKVTLNEEAYAWLNTSQMVNIVSLLF